MNRICLKCGFYVEGVVYGCFIPVLKSDKKLEVTGCEQCIKEVAEKVRESKILSLDETKRLIGLEDNNSE